MEEVKNKLVLKFKKLQKDAKIPPYALAGDAGFGLYTISSEVIKKGEIKTFHLGIASEIPESFFVSIRDRSGLATKFGIHVLAGVIDAGYRGEWMVCLVNLGRKSYKVLKGEKIAQGILQEVPKVKILEARKLSDSERGTGGFGSTGKK